MRTKMAALQWTVLEVVHQGPTLASAILFTEKRDPDNALLWVESS